MEFESLKIKPGTVDRKELTEAFLKDMNNSTRVIPLTEEIHPMVECPIIPLTEEIHPMVESPKIMKVKIKYHNGMEQWPLEKSDKGDWIDLRAAEDVEMISGQFYMISLGISMQLPEGYHAQLVTRSSTFKNFGIIMTNSIGIIDNSYCGDNDIWRFPALCCREIIDAYEGVPVPIKIHKGDRIAQFRIVRNSEPVTFIPVDTLGNADRGGFGSSGVK